METVLRIWNFYNTSVTHFTEASSWMEARFVRFTRGGNFSVPSFDFERSPRRLQFCTLNEGLLFSSTMPFVPAFTTNVWVWHPTAMPSTTNLALKFGRHFQEVLQDGIHNGSL